MRGRKIKRINMKFTNEINRYTNLIKSVAMFFFIAVLVACGGGGGPSDPVSGAVSPNPFFITAPSTLNLASGDTQSFSVGGGTALYQASSSNLSVATVIVSGATFKIVGLATGAAQISVFDATGKSLSINVIVGAGNTSTVLYTTAPGNVSLSVGTAPAYTIGGGTAPYTVSSSNTGVATTNVVNGNQLSVAGVSAGVAQVAVFDAVGKSVTVNITVVPAGNATALYTTAPGSVIIDTAGVRNYIIGGGTSPYSVVSTNASIASASITGATLTINGVTGGGATVIVRDAANATVSVSVTVGSASALFATAPSALTIAVAGSSSFTIGGGAAPYATSSSSPGVATAAISGTTLLITGITAGSAQINVLDSTGTAVKINVTVGSGSVSAALFTTAPSSTVIALAATPTYTVSGGVAPYAATSDDVRFVSAVINGATLSMVGVATGSANVFISDAVGTVLKIGITVPSMSSTAPVVLPNASTANVGDTLRFSLSGGVAPYSASVNSQRIASVSAVANGVFTATLLNVGSTPVVIVDSLGQTTTLTLTVTNTATSLRLSPSALVIAEDSISDIVLNIFGGTAPYTGYTSDLVQSSIASTGSTAVPTLTVGVGAAKGTRCINPVDSSGVYVISGTYDVTLTVVDSLGASATSILTLKDNGKGLSGNGCS
jgi:hypothetical protein